MVYCNECKKKTEATSVSSDLRLKAQTLSRSNYVLIDTEIKRHSVLQCFLCYLGK